MQILTVSPVVRGAIQGELTYFSKEPIPVGMVVVVPIRTREVPAIVLACREASEEKSLLKSSDYAIRKITHSKPRRIWTPAFLRAAEETANLSAQKLGETLLALSPKAIIDAHLEGTIKEPESFETPRHTKTFVIQESEEKRLESYQRLVRESFVRNESVFICVPTEDDVLRIETILGHGIENYTFAFHSSIAKKCTIERWTNAQKEAHAILVIGTVQYLGLPRYFKTIILDEEHSQSWKMMVRPLFDLRIFVEAYAHSCGSTLIVGAPILRAETQERIANGAIGEFDRISMHAREETRTILVDPRLEEKSIRENTGRREMILATEELREMLTEASLNNTHTLLLSARKGLSPVTVCGDCGTLVRCPECDTPLVIHRKQLAGITTQNEFDASNIFICHGCGFMRVPENNVHETCPNCGGWKLQGMGIGIDRIDDEVAKLFPETPRFILDSERAKTRSQAKKIIEQFEKSRGGVLIATPMALPLLKKIENAAIVSIDSLFAIPNIRMSERIFALVLVLREKTTEKLLVQTRADDTSIFDQALHGNLAEFSENELALRKSFSYPPFGTIIKITLRGKKEDVAGEMERLKIFLNDYAPIVPGAIAREPARHSLSLKGSSRAMAGEPKNIFRMHMILKLAEGVWPEKTLLAKLRALPMQFTVEVNPDHLL